MGFQMFSVIAGNFGFFSRYWGVFRSISTAFCLDSWTVRAQKKRFQEALKPSRTSSVEKEGIWVSPG
jgi:hypothetical protein